MAQAVRRLSVTPGPTQAAFITSTKFCNVIMGPRREGKTLSGLLAMLHHAERLGSQFYPIPWAIVRTTRRELGTTTATTIREWMPEGVASKWWGKEKEWERCILYRDGKTPIIEAHLIGIHNEGDLSKFQGLGLGGLWLEEVSPAADLWGGIDAEVLGMGISSLSAVPYPRVQLTFNPPDIDHWAVKLWPDLAEDPSEVDLSDPSLQHEAFDRVRRESAVYRIARGENKALDWIAPGYREQMRDWLIATGRADLVTRLYEGKVGAIQIGEPVTPEFTPAHVAESLAPCQRGERLLLGWDGGKTPACVVCRCLPGRPAEFVAAFQGQNQGMEQFITAHVLPWFIAQVPVGVSWDHTGDPNLTTTAEATSNLSAFEVIQKLLRGREWYPGPVSVDERREPVHEILHRTLRPMVPWARFDKRWCRPLIQGLEGQWHYRKDATGRVIQDNWVKNLLANVCEAFAYTCALLVKRDGRTKQMAEWNKKYLVPRPPSVGRGTRTGA